MSLTWEPRWEPYRVEYAGIKFWTCRDKITKMIACPICINAAKECLSDLIENPPSHDKSERENSFFFSERDLILHIKNHFKKPWIKERMLVKVLEEEEEREEEG